MIAMTTKSSMRVKPDRLRMSRLRGEKGKDRNNRMTNTTSDERAPLISQ